MSLVLGYAGRVLQSIAIWLWLVVGLLLNYPIALLLWLLTNSFDPDRRLVHWWASFWGLQFFANPGWRLTVRRRSLIKNGKPYVLVANHGSIADIGVLFPLFRQFKWVAKEEVFHIPIVGWAMRHAAYVPVRRGDRSSVEEMFRQCRHWLDRRISILMFPEGSRSPDGRIRDFKPGAFVLAREKKVPVVPIVVVGSDTILPKHSFWFRGRSRIIVEVLPPMGPGGFDSAEAFAQSVRQVMVARHRELLMELPEEDRLYLREQEARTRPR